MTEEGNLVWIASYPKSGNTWFRAFLANLKSGREEQISINSMSSTPIVSSRTLFEQYLPIESSDFTHDEIDLIRPEFYRSLSKDVKEGEKSYHKIHDAFTKNTNLEWMFPPEITFGAIYIIRNPLDISISLSNHRASDIDQSVSNIIDHKFGLGQKNGTLQFQLRQNLGTWSDHVRSWKAAPINVCFIRYEDMKLDAFNTFQKTVRFLQFNKNDKEIKDAITKCSFQNLRKQEEERGFREKPQEAVCFFRKGEIGDWKNYLNAEHVRKLIDCNSEVMEEFGYLNDGNLVF